MHIRTPRTSPWPPRTVDPPQAPDPVAEGPMAASKMGFSPSSPPGARPRCPTHAGEPRKHAGGPRRPQHRVERSCPLDTTPLGPSGRPEHAHHARAERAGRDWAGPGSTYRAPPRVRARTCSARTGGRAAPRRAVRRTTSPSRRTRARARADVHAARGREEHEGHECRPRPRGSRAGHGAQARGRSLHLHAPHGAADGRAPKPSAAMPGCARDVHAGRARGSRTARGCHPRPRGPRAGQRSRPCEACIPCLPLTVRRGRPDHP